MLAGRVEDWRGMPSHGNSSGLRHSRNGLHPKKRKTSGDLQVQ
jgi:hypothetical protein